MQFWHFTRTWFDTQTPCPPSRQAFLVCDLMEKKQTEISGARLPLPLISYFFFLFYFNFPSPVRLQFQHPDYDLPTTPVPHHIITTATTTPYYYHTPCCNSLSLTYWISHYRISIFYLIYLQTGNPPTSLCTLLRTVCHPTLNCPLRTPCSNKVNSFGRTRSSTPQPLHPPIQTPQLTLW